MSTITIQCRLVATEETRRYLWNLMTERYTALINELLKRVAHDPSFEEWCNKGNVALEVINQFCKKLKKEPQFNGQPGRFYQSASILVHRIYKSWIALQKRLRDQIVGRKRWLEILQSDEVLLDTSKSDLNALRATASELLNHLKDSKLSNEKPKSQKSQRGKSRQIKSKQPRPSVFNTLFQLYEETKETNDVLTRCAIAYLLKNDCKITEKLEDSQKFNKRRRRVEIRLERSLRVLERTRLPKGRDLTWETWLQTLAEATTHVPKDEDEAVDWQASLLAEAAKLPFPVNYETNEDLRWFLKVNYAVRPNVWLRGVLISNASSTQQLRLIKLMFLIELLSTKGRLCVKLSGLDELSFQIYCDQRQLHWFERFLEDQEIKRSIKKQYTAGLLTLRSARIAWQEGKGKGEPWNIHRISLFCTVDTRLWTIEGTDQVRQEKAVECAKVIAKNKAKGHLNQNQKDFVGKREKTLTLLSYSHPTCLRPSRPLYQGQPSILAGISYGLHKPATLAIVDIQTGKAITYRSIRQLLGENYRLLNRYRLRQQRNSHRRHNNQRKNASNRLKESNVGEYIDRLIADAIVAIAQEYRVSSLVLPNLGDIREVIQSEVQTKAEQKILGSVESQRQYALQYRASVHRWSYARLGQCIQNKAAQVGIVVETGKQPLTGTPQEKAKNLAIAAYQSRK